MWKKLRRGFAPRLAAARSRLRSMVRSDVPTATATNGRARAVCATTSPINEPLMRHWTNSPNIPIAMPGSTRPYTRFSDAIRDGIDGRILNGLHFRHADVAGAWIGKKAAQWVNKHEFAPVD